MSFEQKIFAFMSAFGYIYANDEEREGAVLPSLELKEESLTEDFTAMIYALRMFYVQLTDDRGDILDFLNVMTRLVFQRLAQDNAFKDEKEDTESDE